MNRRDFLRGLGAATVGAAIPHVKAIDSRDTRIAELELELEALEGWNQAHQKAAEYWRTRALRLATEVTSLTEQCHYWQEQYEQLQNETGQCSEWQDTADILEKLPDLCPSWPMDMQGAIGWVYDGPEYENDSLVVPVDFAGGIYRDIDDDRLWRWDLETGEKEYIWPTDNNKFTDGITTGTLAEVLGA